MCSEWSGNAFGYEKHKGFAMATRRMIAQDDAADELQIIEGAVEEDVTHLRDEEAAMENDIDAEMGSSAQDVSFKISVYRIPDTGKDLIFLFSLPGENVAGIRERLMEDHGSGHYSIQVYKVLPKKGARIHRKYRLKLELPKRAAPPPQAPENSALLQAVTKQGDLLQQMLTRISAAPAPEPAKQQSFLEMAQGFAAMMTAMREMMPAPAPAPAAANPLEFMTQVIELAKGLQDETREKGVIDLVGDLIKSPMFESAIAGLGAAAQPPPATQRRIAASQLPGATIPPGSYSTPPKQNAQPQQVNAAPTAQEIEAEKFLSLLAELVDRAANNSDAGLWAEVVVDKLGGQTLQSVLALPDPIGALAQANPAVATYRGWFGALIEEVRDMLTAEADGVEGAGALEPTATAPRASGSAPATVTAYVNPERYSGGEADAEANEPLGS